MNAIWRLGEPIEAHVFGLWVTAEIARLEREPGVVGARILDTRQAMRGLTGAIWSLPYAEIRRVTSPPSLFDELDEPVRPVAVVELPA